MTRKAKLTIYELVVCAMMTGIICIFAPMSVPIGLVPISLTNLVLYFMVYILGMRGTLISYTVYLLLGIVGLPVFSNYTGGVGKLAGPTGGYLIGFYFMIAISGLALALTYAPWFERTVNRTTKNRDVETQTNRNQDPDTQTEQNRETVNQAKAMNKIRVLRILITICGMILGTAVAYAFGTAWFVFQQQCEVKYALTVCVYPFIPFDLAKIAVASVLGFSVRMGLTRADMLPKI